MWFTWPPGELDHPRSSVGLVITTDGDSILVVSPGAAGGDGYVNGVPMIL